MIYGTNGTKLRDNTVPMQATSNGTNPCKGLSRPVAGAVALSQDGIERKLSRRYAIQRLLGIPGVKLASTMMGGNDD